MVSLLLLFSANAAFSATHPPVAYDKQAQALLLKKIENNPPLSPTDAKAIDRILALLPKGDRSGFVYAPPNEHYVIDYTFDQTKRGPLQVEITYAKTSKDIDRVKAEAFQWFEAQGLSKKGICDYPVAFYLNDDVALGLKGKGIVFTPIAEGCAPGK